MTELTRRAALTLGGLAALSGAAGAGARDAASHSSVARDLETYIGFGAKNAGGPGDTASGDWMARELERAGFDVQRHIVQVPALDLISAALHHGEGETAALPLYTAPLTPPQGIEGPLVRFSFSQASQLEGAIALIDLPHGRWSTAAAPAIRSALEAAFGAGALAAVLATNGPTGDAIQLNIETDGGAASRPTVIVAPHEADSLHQLAETQGRARLIVQGRQGVRQADNIAATLRRGTGRWLVVSTPRSGWTTCAGERGPGIAAFLALAREAAASFPAHDLLFLCTTGHEFENHGVMEAIEAIAPQPADTDLWFHLGAGFAARDWHEAGAAGLLPLPSADPQRYLLVADGLLDLARSAFAGHAGLEMVYPVSAGAAGELGEIARAGYPRCGGMFGAHRFHHVDGDDARCVDAALVAPVIDSLREFLRHAAS
ncbi:hypothetical protein FKB34_11905 [Glycocaulis profundi]|nr:hypothetical protein FKB34_11905 [Glycocaulis profundi]